MANSGVGRVVRVSALAALEIGEDWAVVRRLMKKPFAKGAWNFESCFVELEIGDHKLNHGN